VDDAANAAGDSERASEHEKDAEKKEEKGKPGVARA